MSVPSVPGPELARPRAGRPEEPAPPPGRQAVLIAKLALGVLLLGIQLWLLTVALDLYLSGDGSDVWTLALFSGAVFLGGLVAIRLPGGGRRIQR